MAIYGLHTSHDSCSAKIQGESLIYSYELEKFDESRYAYMRTRKHEELLIPEIEEDEILVLSGAEAGNIEVDGEVFPYNSIGYSSGNDNPLRIQDSYLPLPNRCMPIDTVYHTTCHVVGSYCASPFAQRGEGAFISMWDGGVRDMLFYIDYDKMEVTYFGFVTNFNGSVFMYSSLYWGPDKLPCAHKGDLKDFEKEVETRRNREHPDHVKLRGTPGVLMAYQGLGKVNEDVVAILKRTDSDAHQPFPSGREYPKLYTNLLDFEDPDIVASIYHYLGQKKIKRLLNMVRGLPGRKRNLILTGGCALNIKWNSAIRSTGEFEEVWAPPFCNDTGIALGAATTRMAVDNKSWDFEWDVYRGQELITTGYTKPYKEKWKREKCNLIRLAEILHYEDEPVVFLKGRAELGPRALGHRSILASPKNPEMKQRLNEIKGRAEFRPVAPICMEEHAPDYFTPGTPDPFMLFDHQVKESVKDTIPAVIHVDNTARLQTINKDQESDIYELLDQFYQLSGIPMLCNTSANERGKGFFPSITSALDWGRTKYVWAEGYLYEKVD